MGDRGHGKQRVVPYSFVYLQHRGIGLFEAVKTLVLNARVRLVMGEAMTSVVTHAWSAGSRWEAWL